ncbi:MAG TPA: hypothetical protein VNN22_26245 [Verrucomicrobiae bacterium]|nr:hypothetical protein [Verrucomicrobiae bacterium]
MLVRQSKQAIRVFGACLLVAWAGVFGFYGALAQTNEPVLGQVVVWGPNSLGLTNVPADLTNVIAIAAGSVHSVALKSDGTVRAWGSGNNGETNVPSGLSNVVAIAAAGFYGNNYGYSLALKVDGTVTGWGAVSLPSGLSNVVEVAAGAYWWMALRSDGTVTANYPYLTNGLLNLGTVPLSNVVAIASGDRHLLALTRAGTVVGWGSDNYGQATGVPGNLYYSNGIVMLNGLILSNVVAIAAGSQHSVALKSDGTVVAWGNNAFGQTNVPSGLSNVIAIALGGNESANQVLAVKADGKLVAWGGSGAQTNVPIGMTNVMVAAVGSAHSLALIGAKPLTPQVRLSAPVWNYKTFSFSLPTQSGRIYSLECKSSLLETSWTPILLAAGNGHMRTLTESNATNLSRFYRVQQW